MINIFKKSNFKRNRKRSPNYH